MPIRIIGQEVPTPLDDLFEKFPDVYRNIVVKNDVMNLGLRYTPVLGHIGKSTIPYGTFSYEMHTDEMKRGEVSRSQAEGGVFDLPSFMKFRDGITMGVLIKEDSPYEIRYEGEGTYMLYWNGMAVEEVLFVARPNWFSKTTEDGTPLSLILTPFNDCHMVTLSPAYCAFAKTDQECWFCPLTMGEKQLKEMGIDKPVVVTPEKVAEAISLVRDEQYERGKKYLDNKKAICGQPNCRCLSWLITGGSLLNPDQEAERYIPYIEAVRSAAPEWNLYIETQACSPKIVEKLVKAGLHGINFNLEVWDKKMFQKCCPGKAKAVTWEGWTERLAAAVPYFERGHVVSNQVIGLELLPPDGFKTLEEGLASVLEGHEWLASHGVAPSWMNLITFPDSKAANLPVPPTEYFLKVGSETHKIILKHKLYTQTRFFFCYRGCGIQSGDYARLRWGEIEQNDYRDPRLMQKEEVGGSKRVSHEAIGTGGPLPRA